MKRMLALLLTLTLAQGLLAGRSAGGVQTLAPLGTVTRAEFSAVLKTLCETVLPKQ